MARLISDIAHDIRREWGAKIYYGARPYLEAMLSLSTLDQQYGCEEADGIVLRFLSEAAAFRGPRAKELKRELNDMLKEHLSARDPRMRGRS